MIQDALYDAEEHLRSELAENPGMSEAELLAKISTTYGAPEEVADIYRTTEKTVARALRSPRRARGVRPPAASSACWPIRTPTARCSTCCWRSRPASSISRGRSPDWRYRADSR